MKRFLYLFIAVTLLIGCSKGPGQNLTPSVEPLPSEEPEVSEEPSAEPSEEPSAEPSEEPSQEPSEEPLPWVDGYPQGVSVEPFTEEFTDGKKCVGWVATIDFSANPHLRFTCRKTSKKKGPSAFFSSTPEADGVPCLATNGGYFAGSTSVSLVAHGGDFICSAYRAFNWPNDENAQCSIYPVRSAIGWMEDGSFEIQWVYCTNPGYGTHIVYPSPLDNNEKTEQFMQEAPTADYCEGTYEWHPQEAIGGGPRLVKDGVDVSTDSYWGECLNAGGTSGFSRVPRTAAGITADNKLILIVCDGRGSNGSAGYTLAELSAKFISLGCTDAMNLDGGGSSCMVGTDGQILNKPSDGSERPVTSAIVITEKYD